MFSVFYHMSEFMVNVLFGIAERVFLKKPTFVEEYKITLKNLDRGWILSTVADRRYAEYRGKNIMFRPKFAFLHETSTVKKLPTIVEQRKPEAVYVTWSEVASDDFFKDVEVLFKRVRERQGVAGTTGRGG